MEKHWRDRFAGFGEPTVLGVGNPASHAGSRAVHEAALSEAESAGLGVQAGRLGVDVSLLALAAWSLLLTRYGAGDDLVFGTSLPGVGGAGAGKDGVPGHAAPLLPVRVKVDPRQCVRTFLTTLAGSLPDPHQPAPTPEGLRSLGELPQDVPLFDKAIRVSDGPVTDTDTALLLQATVSLVGQATLSIDHDTARLDEADALRMLRHFRRILSSLADAASDTPVGEIDPLSPAELRQILHEWNDTATDRTDPACIHELVERQAARTPDALAVVQGEHRLTYAELDREAGLVAAGLAARGVGPGDFVALHLERTVHSVVALLGVLKSGAAYAPIEYSLPAGRVRHLLHSLRAPVVVCSPDRVEFLRELCAELPRLRHILWIGGTAGAPKPTESTAPPETPAHRVSVAPATAPAPADAPGPRRASPDDLAYVIFTSGSTGTPKGVLLTHAPVVNLIRWVNSTFGVGPHDRVLFLTAFGFDLSVYDVFGLLAAGGVVRVASEDELRDPQRLLSVLDEEPITFWDSAPAALQQLEPLLALREPPHSAALRLVFLSGDWIPVALPDTLRTAFPGAEVVSLGGATEAAIWSNFHRVGTVDPRWSSIPYGRPINNARYYLLDRELRPAPVGVPGDLYIGGHCLASGYHADPALTARKFLPDPFVDEPGARMYHTGDRARFWADGTMEFLGRTDSQVKLRGFRVELGEVEAALHACDGVGTAVAHVHGTAESARLAAYAVPAPGSRLDPRELRERLTETLPAFMVPGEVVILGALPVTRNGKLDRHALAASGHAAGPASDPPGAEPATPVEAAVAKVWAEILGRPADADSHFFALGGQSLLAVRTIARLNATLPAGIPLRTLMDHPRLRDFVREAEPFLSGRTS